MWVIGHCCVKGVLRMAEEAKVGDTIVFIDEPLPDGTRDTSEYTVIECPDDLKKEKEDSDTFIEDKDGWVFCVFPEEYRIVRRKL